MNLKGKKALGWILIVLGALYLIASFTHGFNLWRFIWNLWPLAVILLGIYIIVNRGRIRDRDSGDKVEKIFGELKTDFDGQEIGTLDISLFIGELDADLTGATFLTGENHLFISMGMGKAEVVVPENIPLKITSRLFAGEISYNDRENSGVFPRLDHVDDGYDSAEKKLRVYLDGFAGEMSIRC